jgi:hypothetical protein
MLELRRIVFIPVLEWLYREERQLNLSKTTDFLKFLLGIMPASETKMSGV